MSLRSDASRRVRWRWRRLGVGTGLLAVLSAVLMVSAPGTAQAVTPTEPCSNFTPEAYGNAHFVSYDYIGGIGWRPVLTVFYFLEPPVETFNISESAAVFNQLPTTSQATFTSSTQRTFTIMNSQTLTTSVTNMMGATFQSQVNQSITNSWTTTIGFSTTVEVPPNSRVQGDFGVRAFILHYNMARWEVGGGRCWWRPEMGRQDVFTNAPTNIQEWRTHLQ